MMSEKKLQEAWRYAYRAAHKTQRRHDHGEAEDAAQEAMLRLLQGRAGGKDTASAGWFAMVAHNYVLSQGRRKQIRARKDRVYVGSQRAEPAHLEVERQEAGVALVERLMEALPEYYRGVVQLAIVDGKPLTEVALLLAIPVGTVMSRLHRAREILKWTLRKLA